MVSQDRPLAGKRIGIVGKGGSGKSTLTVLLARALRDQGYGVCVLDADSTNIGLNQAFGMKNAPASLIDYFGGMVFSGGAVTCPVDDPTPLPGAENSLEELSDGYFARSQEGIVLITAGKIGDMGPGAGCDGPISKIARDFRIKAIGSPPITVVDFKAGFEDSARGVITSVNWVIVVVDPTKAAIQMAVHMRDMVDKLKAGSPPATEHLESPELVELAKMLFKEARVKGVLVVLNRVGDDQVESYLRSQLAERGLDPIAVIPEAPELMTAWLKGIPLPSGKADAAAEGIIAALETAEHETLPSGEGITRS